MQMKNAIWIFLIFAFVPSATNSAQQVMKRTAISSFATAIRNSEYSSTQPEYANLKLQYLFTLHGCIFLCNFNNTHSHHFSHCTKKFSLFKKRVVSSI